jgi:hypothetical protein
VTECQRETGGRSGPSGEVPAASVARLDPALAVRLAEALDDVVERSSARVRGLEKALRDSDHTRFAALLEDDEDGDSAAG